MKTHYTSKIFCFAACFFCVFTSLFSQNTPLYRIILKDKGTSQFQIDKPQDYLSPKAILRRTNQGIAIDSTDLPIDSLYLSQIEDRGGIIRSKSKWVKTVVVACVDSSVVEDIGSLPFVEDIVLVWLNKSGIAEDYYFELAEDAQQDTEQDKGIIPFDSATDIPKDINYYGTAFHQINMLQGHYLHEAGFRGEGMTVAIIDGGFGGVDKISQLSKDRILGVKNFTHIRKHPYNWDNSHGTHVLSTMLANAPGEIVGTAPNANYYLLSTEVTDDEFPVEEDYWIAAIEYADSIGVDVCNTSLGYTSFDIPQMNHQTAELDGHTVLISRAAGMAAQKGMLLFNAAGNEGNKLWKKISFPADAKNIVTVGSVDAQGIVSSFSSRGMSADGRVKPNLMAQGTRAAYIDRNGGLTFGNGTSIASPILAGMGACIWQALPNLTNMEIIDLLHKSASQWQYADSTYGYGIPNIYAAYSSEVPTGLSMIDKDLSKVLFFDTVSNLLYIKLNAEDLLRARCTIYNTLGRIVLDDSQFDAAINLSFLSRGIYLVSLRVGAERVVVKIAKA